MTALLIRDLRLAVRAGGGFGLGLAFFLIVVVLVPFAVGPAMGLLERIAPGVLWIGALLACLLSLDRIFALDREDGSLDLLAVSPLPLEGVVAVKAFAHWLTTGLPLVAVAPVLGLLLSLPEKGVIWLVVSLLAGTPALSVIGAFGSGSGSGTKFGSAAIRFLSWLRLTSLAIVHVGSAAFFASRQAEPRPITASCPTSPRWAR